MQIGVRLSLFIQSQQNTGHIDHPTKQKPHGYNYYNCYGSYASLMNTWTCAVSYPPTHTLPAWEYTSHTQPAWE